MKDFRAMNLLFTFDNKPITMKELNSLDKHGAQVAPATKNTDEGDGPGKAVIYSPLPVAIVQRGDLVDLSKLKIKIGDFGSGLAALLLELILLAHFVGQSGARPGLRSVLAPEIILGQDWDTKADRWSLGVMARHSC